MSEPGSVPNNNIVLRCTKVLPGTYAREPWCSDIQSACVTRTRSVELVSGDQARQLAIACGSNSQQKASGKRDQFRALPVPACATPHPVAPRHVCPGLHTYSLRSCTKPIRSWLFFFFKQKTAYEMDG